jgi:hypothetical protein
MSCYRLTFENTHAFDVVIEPDAVMGSGRGPLHIAVIHRVVQDRREIAPLQSERGGPIRIAGVTEHAALHIATEVLKQVTGSPVSVNAKCEHQ